MDIRTKLMLALVSVSLLSIALFGVLIYLLSADLILRTSGRDLGLIAASKAREIERVIDGWRAEIAQLTERTDLLALPDAVAGGEPATALEGARADLARRVPALRWIHLGNRQEPAAEGEVRVMGARSLPEGGIDIVLTAPLPSGQLEAGFRANALEPIMADRTGLGTSGEALVLAPSWIDAQGERRAGYLLVTPSIRAPAGWTGSDHLAAAPEVIAAALRSGGAERLEGDFFGAPVVAVTHPVPDSEWQVMVNIDRGAVLAPLDELLRDLWGLGLSLGAFAILAGVVFGMYLARPIRRLADTVERIRHGELELRAAVEGEDEVALLARSLNRFMDQLDRSSDIFQLGSLRVLVVEDQPASRQLLHELLTNWRMQAVLVSDGASAVESVADADQAGDPIQLIVLDESVPDMDAMQLLARLAARGEGQRCPVVLLASDPKALDTPALQRMGIRHVVPKPVLASDLMDAILDELGVSASAMVSLPDVFLSKPIPRRILLAEDSPIIQRVTVGFLERWGHDVTVAANGRLAVEAARRATFDVILMDLEMPEMDGLEATRAIRAMEGVTGMRTPIIALTARATSADREACMAAGMDDYASKPLDPKVLFRLVDTRPARSHVDTPPPAPEETARVTSERSDREAGGESPVNWELARNLTEGNAALLDELIVMFPAESARLLEALRAGLDEGDAGRLTRAAHSLKSAAGYFGAAKLVACAREMEQLGRAEKLDQVRLCLPRLEAELARLTAALQRERPPG